MISCRYLYFRTVSKTVKSICYTSIIHIQRMHVGLFIIKVDATVACYVFYLTSHFP